MSLTRGARRALFAGAVGVAMSLGTATVAHAQNTFSVTGSPTLRVNTAVAGSPPTSASASNTSYTFDTNGTSATLQAKLSAALPAGVSLQVSAAPPPGVTANGYVTLTTAYQDLTSLIPRNKNGTYTITHRLVVTSGAGVVTARTASIDWRLF